MSKLEKMNENIETRNNFWIWVSTAFIGISLIIMQDYISTGVSDTPIFISVIAFSISLPLLAGTILSCNWQKEVGYFYREYSSNIAFFGFIFGIFFGLIGVSAAFWHVSWIAGLVFIIVSIVSFTIFIYSMPISTEVKRLRREEAEREKALE